MKKRTDKWGTWAMDKWLCCYCFRLTLFSHKHARFKKKKQLLEIGVHIIGEQIWQHQFLPLKLQKQKNNSVSDPRNRSMSRPSYLAATIQLLSTGRDIIFSFCFSKTRFMSYTRTCCMQENIVRLNDSKIIWFIEYNHTTFIGNIRAFLLLYSFMKLFIFLNFKSS